MKFKVRPNVAMYFIFIVYAIYTINNFNLMVLIAGILFYILWYCCSDAYYKIEKGNLIVSRIIGRKEIRIKDINAIIDPIPVLHRLNPRPGTLAIYREKKRLHVCPKDQVGFVKALQKANKKMNVKVESVTGKQDKK